MLRDVIVLVLAASVGAVSPKPPCPQYPQHAATRRPCYQQYPQHSWCNTRPWYPSWPCNTYGGYYNSYNSYNVNNLMRAQYTPPQLQKRQQQPYYRNMYNLSPQPQPSANSQRQPQQPYYNYMYNPTPPAQPSANPAPPSAYQSPLSQPQSVSPQSLLDYSRVSRYALPQYSYSYPALGSPPSPSSSKTPWRVRRGTEATQSPPPTGDLTPDTPTSATTSTDTTTKVAVSVVLSPSDVSTHASLMQHLYPALTALHAHLTLDLLPTTEGSCDPGSGVCVGVRAVVCAAEVLPSHAHHLAFSACLAHGTLPLAPQDYSYPDVMNTAKMCMGSYGFLSWMQTAACVSSGRGEQLLQAAAVRRQDLVQDPQNAPVVAFNQEAVIVEAGALTLLPALLCQHLGHVPEAAALCPHLPHLQ